MLTMQKGENGNGYGLGLALNATGTPGANFGHGGSNQGYRAQMILFSETGDGAVVMTNSETGAEVVVEVMRSLAREYGWPRYRPVEKTAVVLDPAVLRDVVGRYEATASGNTLMLSFAVQDGQMVGTVSTWPSPRVLFPLSATEPRFFIREAGPGLHLRARRVRPRRPPARYRRRRAGTGCAAGGVERRISSGVAGSARAPPPLAQARTSPKNPWGRLEERGGCGCDGRRRTGWRGQDARDPW